MKRAIAVSFAILVLATMAGCANGRCRNMFRGAPCDTCRPPMQPALYSNCPTGTCGSGVAGAPVNEGGFAQNPQIPGGVVQGNAPMTDAYNSLLPPFGNQ